MASVWKRPKDRRDNTKPWQIKYRGADGKWHYAPGLLDKRETERLAARMEDEADQRRRGMVDQHAAGMALQEARPIAEHLAEFAAYLRSKGTSAQTIDTAEVRIRRILEKARAARIADLTPTAVLGALEQLRKPGEITPRGLSPRTASHYVRAIKSFTLWLVRDKRTRADALSHLQGFNDAADRRRVRRDLHEDEVARVIQAAEKSPWISVPRPERDEKGNRRTIMVPMHYPERCWAYRIAAQTGLRVSEIGSLTPESFDLDTEPPTISCRAAYTKNKQEAVQPIRPDFAGMLRTWLEGKATGKPVCQMPKKKAASLLRVDLAAARAEWLSEATSAADRKRREGSDFLRFTDAAGRVADFHSLRVHYISRVVEAGASVKEAMELARHTDPKLTLRTYAKVRMGSLTGILEGLPSMAPAAPDQERARATGTDGKPADQHPARNTSATPTAAGTGTDGHALAVVGRIGVGEGSSGTSGDSSGSGTERPAVAHSGLNAEGRTRTADLRVMNPGAAPSGASQTAVSRGRATRRATRPGGGALDPVLRTIVESWDKLPGPVRAGIAAMVNAAAR